jgi:predicted alpha/beta superfamily hydrolase
MLAEELKPFVDRTYRTRTGPEDTGLLGSSMGALVSLYLGLHRPDLFARIGALSPAVWWAGRAIVAHVRQLPAKPPLRIWLDMGGREGRHALRDVRALRDALTSRGWVEGEDLRYREIEHAAHTEEAWAARVSTVLRFLYPPRRDAAST